MRVTNSHRDIYNHSPIRRKSFKRLQRLETLQRKQEQTFKQLTKYDTNNTPKSKPKLSNRVL